MKLTEWNSLTEKEKALIILNGDFRVKKVTGISTNAKVGAYNDCVTAFIGMSGKVQLTGQEDCIIKCLDSSKTSLTYWKLQLTLTSDEDEE